MNNKLEMIINLCQGEWGMWSFGKVVIFDKNNIGLRGEDDNLKFFE